MRYFNRQFAVYLISNMLLFGFDFKYGRILQTIPVSEGLLLGFVYWLFEVTENPVCTLFLQKNLWLLISLQTSDTDWWVKISNAINTLFKWGAMNKTMDEKCCYEW